MASRVL